MRRDATRPLAISALWHSSARPIQAKLGVRRTGSRPPHEDGTRARYAHLARFAPGLVRGTRLAAGQAIGVVGRTGRTTGPNLHVELRRGGRPVDPWPWMTRTACTSWTEVAEAEPIR
ncbi:MAG: hypothetical protein B7Z40_03285 [Bosea sp. 12-68-7]|nr:MAG: hypothetical protein B7Z40_03285 [Bosea sp. 12-68-7]